MRDVSFAGVFLVAVLGCSTRDPITFSSQPDGGGQDDVAAGDVPSGRDAGGGDGAPIPRRNHPRGRVTGDAEVQLASVVLTR